MKKLFAILMSFQLIISPVALATDEYMASGTGSKGGYDFYTNQILVLATSAVGTSIITGCMKGLSVPSIGIYAGGSLVHMLSEITGAKAVNENHKNRLKDLKLKQTEIATKGDSAQKTLLQERLKEEQATLEFLNNRKLWMTAVSVIHMTAMGFAIGETIADKAAKIAAGGFLVGPALPFYAYCKPSPKLGLNWSSALKLAYGFGSGKLGESGGQITQYGTLLISGLGVIVPSVGGKISALYSESFNRSITFGVSGVLSATVASGLYKRAGIAKKNIESLKSVIAQFKTDSDGLELDKLDLGGKDSDPSGDGSNDSSGPKYKAGKMQELIVNKKKECLSTSGSDFVVSSAACSRPVKINKPASLANFNLPTMNKVNSLSSDLAQALVNGDENLAANIAGEIGSYAAKVKSETDALKVAYNKAQKEKGQPTTDFDKSINDQVAALQGSMNQAAGAANINLASLGPAAGEVAAEKTETMAPEEVKVNTASTPSVEMPIDTGFSMDSTEEVPAEGPVAAGTPEATLDDFESPVQDISKKTEASIFKQVSDRYILNYTKMFETKPRAELVSEPPKN